MKKLRIALLSRVWESVPPNAYGGTEQIVAHLANGLVRRGYDVELFASADSKTLAKLDSVIKQRVSSEKNISSNEQMFRELANIKNCFDRADEFDIIHSHVGVFGYPFIDLVKTPVVSTLHTLIRPNQVQLHQMVKNGYFCSISKTFQKICPEVQYFDYAYNGIDIDKFDFNENPENKLINIGRMVPEKGFKEALEIAKSIDEKIEIAAPIPEEVNESNSWLYDKDYWENEVKPLLDGKDRKYVGEITDKEKSSFFGSAKALLFPLQWEEPFGLTVVEAMATGTPVITYNRGAMSELVEDGVTGFVVKPGDSEGLKKAIVRIGQIDRKKCRERVKELFSTEKMIDKYDIIYDNAIKNQKERQG